MKKLWAGFDTDCGTEAKASFRFLRAVPLITSGSFPAATAKAEPTLASDGGFASASPLSYFFEGSGRGVHLSLLKVLRAGLDTGCCASAKPPREATTVAREILSRGTPYLSPSFHAHGHSYDRQCVSIHAAAAEIS